MLSSILPFLTLLSLEAPLVFEREVRTFERLREPTAACFLEEDVLILEREGGNIRRYGESGDKSLIKITSDGSSSPLARYADLACEGGQFAVLDSGNAAVHVHDGKRGLLRTLNLTSRDGKSCLNPQGLALRGNQVAVADTGRHQVLLVGSDGTTTTRLGGYGGGQGEFRAPEAVALHADGRIVVADTGNDRIQVFSNDGELLTLWGDRGTRPGLFSRPTDLFILGDALYVTDQGNHRVQVFDMTGELLGGWGRHVVVPHEGKGRLHYPRTVRLSADGQRAVACEPFEERCQLLSVGEMGEDQAKAMAAPAERASHHGQRAAVTGQLLALSTEDGGSVTLFDLSRQTPIQIHVVGDSGDGFGRFLRATGVTWLPGHRLVTADPLTRRLQVFTMDWDPDAPIRFLPELSRFTLALDAEKALTTSPLPPGSLPPEPVALSPGLDGELLVLDGANDRVLVLADDLSWRAQFGGRGTGDGLFLHPTDLCVDAARGLIHVVDSGNKRVQTFDAKGRFKSELRRAGGAPFVDPFGLLLSRDGRLYVSDRGSHQVHRFGPDLKYETSWGAADTTSLPIERLGAGQLHAPAGMVETADGRILVVDHGNHRGQLFSSDGRFLKAFGSRWYVAPTRGNRVRTREER